MLVPEFNDFLKGVGLSRDQIDWVSPEEMEEPAQSLLVHERDMTSALERHYGEAIMLDVRRTYRLNGRYLREVILNGEESEAPVEYGAIEIMLEQFPEHLAKEIKRGRMPLGGILNRHGYPYRSSPLGYFRVPIESVRTVFPNATGGDSCFGRYNQLLSAQDECLALILEILPPSNI